MTGLHLEGGCLRLFWDVMGFLLMQALHGITRELKTYFLQHFELCIHACRTYFGWDNPLCCQVPTVCLGNISSAVVFKKNCPFTFASWVLLEKRSWVLGTRMLYGSKSLFAGIPARFVPAGTARSSWREGWVSPGWASWRGEAEFR